MEVQNTLANRIDASGEMISYDDACKKILANKPILAWIMKYCIEEYKDYDIKEIAERFIEGDPEVSKEALHQDETAEFIEGMNTVDTSIKEGTVKFDIKFSANIPDSRDIVDMIVNVEAQNDFYPGYPIVKRGIYYASRMISSQYGTVFTGSHYEKIKKVNSIWICTNPPQYRQNTITGYEYQEKSIFGDVSEEEDNYNLASVVIICLGETGSKSEQALIKMLSVLFSQEISPTEKKEKLKTEFGIPMSIELESEVDMMCNLSKGVFNNAYDKALVDSIKSLMKTTGWDVEKCMDSLMVPEEKKALYRNKVIEVPKTA